MEKEIDELFLEAAPREIDRDKIRSLERCVDGLPRIHPHLEQVQAKCREIHSSLELYTIKLESLAKEMEGIESENTKLENEILYQTSIYEHLKELLVNVEIKEDHFIALESESFDSVDGLCRIEKALQVLDGFSIEEYDIRIVREREERVNDALRGFYKRFIGHMGKFMAGSGGTGELKVHKGLYGVVKRFKKIIEHSRRYRDYYVVICSIYVAHSKKLYEREFGTHLRGVLRLMREDAAQERVDGVFETLLESLRSIVRCEDRFLKSTGIEGTCKEIFRNVELLIGEFVEDVYEIADVETLNALGRSWQGVEEGEEVYGAFQKELMGTYERLEAGYLGREVGKGEGGIRRLGEVLRGSSNEGLKRRAAAMSAEKIMEEKGRGGLERTMRRWELLGRVREMCGERVEEVEDAERRMEAEFEKSCADAILGDGRRVDNVKKVLSLAGGDRGFRAKVARKMREMVSEDVEEGDGQEVDRLLRKAMNL